MKFRYYFSGIFWGILQALMVVIYTIVAAVFPLFIISFFNPNLAGTIAIIGLTIAIIIGFRSGYEAGTLGVWEKRKKQNR